MPTQPDIIKADTVNLCTDSSSSLYVFFNIKAGAGRYKHNYDIIEARVLTFTIFNIIQPSLSLYIIAVVCR